MYNEIKNGDIIAEECWRLEYKIRVDEIMDTNGEYKEVMVVHESSILVCDKSSGDIERAVAYLNGIRTVEINDRVKSLLDTVIVRSERIIESKIKGIRSTKIACDIGTSEEIVKEVLEVNKKEVEEKEAELKEKALQMYIDGMSREGIVEELGITYTKAKRILYKPEIKKLQEKEEKEILKRILEYKKCDSLEEIAKKEGLSRATVYKMLKRNGMGTNTKKMREEKVKEQIRKMLEEGCNTYIISLNLKCTEETVRKKIKLYGLR